MQLKDVLKNRNPLVVVPHGNTVPRTFDVNEYVGDDRRIRNLNDWAIVASVLSDKAFKTQRNAGIIARNVEDPAELQKIVTMLNSEHDDAYSPMVLIREVVTNHIHLVEARSILGNASVIYADYIKVVRDRLNESKITTIRQEAESKARDEVSRRTERLKEDLTAVSQELFGQTRADMFYWVRVEASVSVNPDDFTAKTQFKNTGKVELTTDEFLRLVNLLSN